jgi:hypothetical protein
MDLTTLLMSIGADAVSFALAIEPPALRKQDRVSSDHISCGMMAVNSS